MTRSSLYKYRNAVDYLGNFPGARRETDRIVTQIHSGSLDVTDRPSRALGSVSVSDLPTVDTDLAAALASAGADTLRVEQQSPVAVEDPNGTAVSPATEGTVASELAREVATWTAGPLSVDSNTPLDVSGATVSVASASPLDVSGATVDVNVTGTVDTTPAADRVDVSATVAASGTTTASASALGAERLVGRVTATGTYDVDVEWKAADGSTVFTDSVAAGVAGGTATDVDVAAISPDADVVVTDTSAAENTVSGVVHLR